MIYLLLSVKFQKHSMIENDSAAGWNRSYFCRMYHLKIVVEEDQKCLENDLRIFLNESSQHAKIL